MTTETSQMGFILDVDKLNHICIQYADMLSATIDGTLHLKTSERWEENTDQPMLLFTGWSDASRTADLFISYQGKRKSFPLHGAFDELAALSMVVFIAKPDDQGMCYVGFVDKAPDGSLRSSSAPYSLKSNSTGKNHGG